MGRILGIAAAIIIIVVGALLLNRAKPPTDLINAKKRDVQLAISRTEADLYAPDAVRAVQESLAVIDLLVDEQARRFPMLRKYDKVLQHLENIDPAILWMEEQARRNKQAMQDEIADLVQQAIETANEVDDELAEAPSGKETLSALAAMRSQLADIRNMIGEVQSKVDAGLIHQARAQALKALTQAEELLNEIKQAKARVRALRERQEF